MAWVLFRADSVTQAFAFLGNVFSMQFGPVCPELMGAFSSVELMYILNQTPLSAVAPALLLSGYFLLAMVLAVGFHNAYEKMCSFKPTVCNLLLTSFLLLWCVFSFAGVSTFLYFNF